MVSKHDLFSVLQMYAMFRLFVSIGGHVFSQGNSESNVSMLSKSLRNSYKDPYYLLEVQKMFHL